MRITYHRKDEVRDTGEIQISSNWQSSLQSPDPDAK